MRPLRSASLLVAVSAIGFFAVSVRPAHAANTCNGFIAMGYIGGQNFSVPGDTLRVELTLGAGSIVGGTKLTVNRVRFELDCSVDSALGVGCTNDGAVVKYAGDSTITTTCPTGFTTGHAASDSPNQVVFTAGTPIAIPAGNLSFCTFAFDVQVEGPSNDSTPDRIEQVVGYSATASDARCDNNLASAGSQSGSIILCPACPGGGECATASCNQTTGQCVNTPKPSSTPCTDTDGNKCTTAGCDANGTCNQTHQTTVCPPDTNDCTDDAACNPQTGACDHPPKPTSTPCADTDGNKCTTAGCDGNGTCSQTHQTTVCTPDADACTDDPACNPQTGTCDHPPITCDDHDPCTLDSCDPSRGCVFSPNPSCQQGCGPLSTDPCLITVSSSSKTFTNLQAAVNAVPNGTTITVRGRCVGATLIVSRSNLTIQGVNPTPAACSADARRPLNLTSTLTCPPGSSDVIKVTTSTNIVIRYLNIVECETGVEFKRSKTSVLTCNCCDANPEDCFELHGGSGHQITQNLITQNGFGINAHDATTNNLIKLNTVTGNTEDGILLEDDTTDSNTVTANDVVNNKRDGISIVAGDLNRVTSNTVTGNGTNAAQDSGIELKSGANKNVIDANVITGNADGLVNKIRCFGGSGNTGSNVTPACQ